MNCCDDFLDIKEKLKEILSEYRYQHSLGVADASFLLAERHGVNTQKAYLAGLLHDCAKELSLCKQVALALRSDYAFDLYQILFPSLLHAPAGSVYAKKEFGIEDEEVLKVIAKHILGTPNMSDLEKIVFVSDYFEENRILPWKEEIRVAAYNDLDSAVLLSCGVTIDYLQRSGKRIHPKLLKTRDYYRNL